MPAESRAADAERHPHRPERPSMVMIYVNGRQTIAATTDWKLCTAMARVAWGG